MKTNKLISALPSLRPVGLWDVATGEAMSIKVLEEDIEQLCSFVQAETKKVFDAQTLKVIADATNLKGSANSYGRQKGYKSDYHNLPREILAKSRINELFLYKLMSETASYAKNPNPLKQYPSFPRTVNLGAVDKQMASLSKDGQILSLRWKCWSREYLIEFVIPAYIIKRDILKYSLPVIRYTKTGYDFVFTTQEAVPILAKNRHSAGLDLGRVEPYTLAVTNRQGARIAHYTTGGRLKGLNRQRENILVHKRNILAKKHQYDRLGLPTEVLVTEKERLTAKAKILGKVISQQLGAEVAHKLEKHALNSLHVENLSWVTGTKYGSKWNHSRQQDAITHALLRNGTRTKKINPKNSSQTCHSCGNALTHTGRKVRCGDCQVVLDRDMNAALNIATLKHLNPLYPSLINRLTGDNCSSIEQVINHHDCKSINKLVT